MRHILCHLYEIDTTTSVHYDVVCGSSQRDLDKKVDSFSLCIPLISSSYKRLRKTNQLTISAVVFRSGYRSLKTQLCRG